MSNPWINIVSQKGAKAEFALEGNISMYENSSRVFDAVLTELEKKHTSITMYMNCYGGSCIEGTSIKSRIDRSRADIKIIVTGVAASMGAVIAADKRRTDMYKYAKMMLHKPSAGRSGSAQQLREAADLIDEWENSLVQQIADSTGLSEDEVRSKYFQEGKDIWLSADQCLKAGLINKVIDIKPVSNSISNVMDLDVSASYDFYKSAFPLIKNNDMNIDEIAASLGVQANEAAVSAKIKELRQIADKYAALEAQLASAKEISVKGLIDGAVSTGKITAGQRPQYEALAKADFDSTKSIIDAMPVRPDVIGSLTRESKEQPTDRAQWTLKDYMENDPEAVKAMRQSDPVSYRKLYKAHYGFEPAM